MIFQSEAFPFPRWLGPYSPARGNNAGFRVRSGLLGATVVTESGQEFWTAQQTQGVHDLVQLIKTHWQGGRIVFLPNGFAVKPLQNDSERVLIGRSSNALILNGSGRQVLDFSNLQHLAPGSIWSGPGTIGLESTLRSDGSLTSGWYRTTEYGQEETQEVIAGPNLSLLEGFRKARPGENSGRVRITIGGHVTTNRQERNGGSRPYYVGQVSTSVFRNWERWIEGRA